MDNASVDTIDSGVSMRNNALTNLLVGLVGFSVVATSALAFYYVRSVQTLNRLQVQTAIINRDRSLASSLAGEVLDYSKRNPAIDPILQSVGMKPGGKPAAK